MDFSEIWEDREFRALTASLVTSEMRAETAESRTPAFMRFLQERISTLIEEGFGEEEAARIARGEVLRDFVIAHS